MQSDFSITAAFVAFLSRTGTRRGCLVAKPKLMIFNAVLGTQCRFRAAFLTSQIRVEVSVGRLQR